MLRGNLCTINGIDRLNTALLGVRSEGDALQHIFRGQDSNPNDLYLTAVTLQSSNIAFWETAPPG